jgi:hypothetical protein
VSCGNERIVSLKLFSSPHSPALHDKGKITKRLNRSKNFFPPQIFFFHSARLVRREGRKTSWREKKRERGAHNEHNKKTFPFPSQTLKSLGGNKQISTLDAVLIALLLGVCPEESLI